MDVCALYGVRWTACAIEVVRWTSCAIEGVRWKSCAIEGVRWRSLNWRCASRAATATLSSRCVACAI